MNRFLRSWQLIALSVLVLLGTSCSKDEDDKPTLKGNILLGSMLPNPDGIGGAAYMQLINNIDAATYTNKTAIGTSFAITPVVRGNRVYVLPGWFENSNLLKIYKAEDGKLVEDGHVELPAKSGVNAMEIVGNKIYVSYWFMGKIGVIDRNTLKVIKEIDITKYAVGDKNPDPAQMVERDGILYVALCQVKAGPPMSDPKRPMVDVLLIDTKKDEPIKMITADNVNMSEPSKPEADDYSMFIDEKGDIYINCISGFGFIGHDAGFLRIKKGETDFDKSYIFKVNKTPIEGEANKASYIAKIRYAGNGILYATADVPAYYSKPPKFAEDKVMFPVKIDLRNKTIKRLGKPVSSNFGFAVSLYQDKVIFGLATKTDKGFFVYDPKTGKMSDKAIIQVTGYPYFFLTIGE